jgi:hypothetical protein
MRRVQASPLRKLDALGETSLIIRIRAAGRLAHRQHQDNEANPECDDDERDTD